MSKMCSADSRMAAYGCGMVDSCQLASILHDARDYFDPNEDSGRRSHSPSLAIPTARGCVQQTLSHLSRPRTEIRHANGSLTFLLLLSYDRRVFAAIGVAVLTACLACS